MTEPRTAPLFTSRFTQGRRTFFFDIKKSKNDKPFLKITESSIKGEDKKRAYLTVFENEIQDFFNAVSEASNFMLKP